MAKNVLVADDNDRLREIVGTILQLWYEISRAATGTEAIEKANSIKPSLISYGPRTA